MQLKIKTFRVYFKINGKIPEVAEQSRRDDLLIEKKSYFIAPDERPVKYTRNRALPWS